MITSWIYDIDSADKLLLSAKKFAENFKKKFSVIYFLKDEEKNEIENSLNQACSKLEIEYELFILSEETTQIAQVCENMESSFLFIQWESSKNNLLRNYLQSLRELRIPYLFFKNDFNILQINQVLVPISFLVEDYEKAQFASAFGRFFQAKIELLLANDYGSKASTTASKMIALFDKFNLNYELNKAKKDSFKLMKEAVKYGEDNRFDIIIISASREYGLDDWIFGSPEQKAIRNSKTALLVVNPRDDLYSLCD